MAALTAAIDDEAQEVEDYSAEFDSVSSFASVAGSPRAAAVAAGEDYSTDSFASFAGSPRAAQVVADDYSEDFESPRAAAAGQRAPRSTTTTFWTIFYYYVVI